jgi:DAK2 domain fusion protein YloV
MSDLDELRRLAGAAAAALEAQRGRIDDLNVYPVPDGDTGTNMSLTARAVVDTLESSSARDRAGLAREVTRAALMGARGNSGVILSQIVRGFADVLGAEDRIDAPLLARAFRSASDAAYRGVKRPVEGTMLTVVRELAEEAEAHATAELPVADLLRAVVERGAAAVMRTQDQLDVLREAGVVDAGGAGLLELVRGAAAAVSGEPLPEPAAREKLSPDAIHQERSRYRYCTAFVVEGTGLDADDVERELEPLGDSLLVVGDSSALKVHVHTDDPGAALSVGARLGALEAVEIANMHRQTDAREQRLLRAVPTTTNRTDAIAVVAGAGNRRLFESLGALVVDGGQSMNPSTADLVAAVERSAAAEALLLPNNANVFLSAEQAAALVHRPVLVVPTGSIQAGLAALVAFDGLRSAAENADELARALEAVATGAVTTASRDVVLNGARVREGEYLGLLDDEPVTGGRAFDDVAGEVVERLLAEPRDVLTLLVGGDQPPLDELLRRVEALHPGLELEVHAGDQPLYHLLIAAE